MKEFTSYVKIYCSNNDHVTEINLVIKEENERDKWWASNVLYLHSNKKLSINIDKKIFIILMFTLNNKTHLLIQKKYSTRNILLWFY